MTIKDLIERYFKYRIYMVENKLPDLKERLHNLSLSYVPLHLNKIDELSKEIIKKEALLSELEACREKMIYIIDNPEQSIKEAEESDKLTAKFNNLTN